MEIKLPAKRNSPSEIKLDSKSFVVIGSNGSGKTRFGYKIEETYNKETHRISAQKSLSMPKQVSPTSKDRAEKDFLYGYPEGDIAHKQGYRWGGEPTTFLLDDYTKLMVLLHTEEYEESIKFKEAYNPGQEDKMPVTKLDVIQRIWETVLPHRKLIKRSGSIEAYPTRDAAKNYNASSMSDGERVIFYLIGEVISAPKNSLMIVDEPEMHIHKSITKNLWDLIEQERPDCTFIYLTHDIDFATSRQNAVTIWLKEFDGSATWDYEILKEGYPLPEQIYLEILGSRKPILFIEGDNSSVDYFLYQQIFTEFTPTPLGNCNKVFETTKSFNDQKSFHHLYAIGIIDRDRRTDSDVNEIRKQNILVPEVAEAENLLLLENVIKTVAARMFKAPDDIFNQVKENVVGLFSKEYKYQATQHSIFVIKKNFERGLNPKVKGYAELEAAVDDFVAKMDFAIIYQEIEKKFSGFIAKEDYLSILKVFNNKGIIQNSGLASLCGLATKNSEFLNFVIGILKQNSNDSKVLRQAVREVIEVKVA